MSKEALERHEVIIQVQSGKLKATEGAVRLQISPRQLRRIVRRFVEAGPAGLNSRRYGQKPGNAISEGVRAAIVGHVEERYQDFGPTLAREKLEELHGIHVSTETVRQIMISTGYWKPQRGVEIKCHPMRARRSRFGELIQIDGSPHDWFEGRSTRCTLLVFIDDATGQLTQLRFAPTETSLEYMHCLHEHILANGIPMALYSDRHSIFRDNSAAGGQTQFGRAVEELGIELICAHSPQAKGRVERVNQTLQDRLIKEMRLLGINDMEAANVWLPEYVEQFNRKFGVVATEPEDGHVEWEQDAGLLRSILSHQEERTLSKELTISYHNRCVQIECAGSGRGMRFAKIKVHEGFDGKIEIRHKGRELLWREVPKAIKQSKIIGGKEINKHLDSIRASRQQSKPAIKHPWRGTLLQGATLRATPFTTPPVVAKKTDCTAHPS